MGGIHSAVVLICSIGVHLRENVFEYFLTSLGCSIGIHLPKMCGSTKFPMFSFVRGSNPRIREKHMKLMKKT